LSQTAWSWPLQRGERLAVAGVLTLGFALRLAAIASGLVAPDEEYTFALASGTWSDLVTETARDTHPPLYYILVKCVFAVTGPSPSAAKILTALATTLAAYLTFLLARVLLEARLGRLPAWIALALSIAAPYQIYWGTAARMHPMLVPCLVAVLLLTYRVLDDERTTRPRMIALAVAWVLALQLNYMALLLLPVWGIAVALEPAAWKHRGRLLVRLALASLPGLALALPWTLLVVPAQVVHGPMRKGFFQEQVSPVFLYFHSIFGDMTPYQQPLDGIVGMALMLVFTIVAVLGYRTFATRWSLWWLLLALPSVPIVTAKLQGMTLAERHLMYALPLAMVYLGGAVSLIAIASRRRAPSASSPSTS